MKNSVEGNRRRVNLLNKKKQDICYAIKAAKGCRVCGEDNPICLDFHHRDEKTKDKKMRNNGKLQFSRLSYDRMMAEIAKCDVICANCHRKLHKGVR